MRVVRSPCRRVSIWYFCPLLPGVTTDVERLWPLTNEAIASRRFETLDELRRGCKPSDVSFFRTTRSIFAGTRFFDFRPLSDS
jgi:hypothetical protein